MDPITVADVVVDGVARAGAARVFTAPACRGPILAAASRRGLATIDATTTAGACVMAAVTGDLTDGPAPLLAGADLLTLAPALASAFRDRAPVIVITGALSTSERESLASAVKGSMTADAASAAHAIGHSVQLALTSPRGPVHVEVAEAVALAVARPITTITPPAPLAPADGGQLDAVASLIAGASRPVVVAGAGCRDEGAAAWLRPFAESLPAPVIVTARAKGALPDPHPMCLGVVTGAAARTLLNRADLVIMLGVDPDELERWDAPATVLHVGAIGHDGAPWKPAVELIAEVSSVLEELAPRVRAAPRADWDVAELDRLKRHGRALGSVWDRIIHLARDLSPARTIAVIDRDEEGDAVVATWDAVAPREFLVPARLAGAGQAIPAAVAAKLARWDRPVVAFTGVTGFAAGKAELPTAVRLRVPIIVVVLGARARPILRAPDVTSVVVDDEAAFASAFTRALAAGAPMIVGV